MDHNHHRKKTDDAELPHWTLTISPKR